MVQKRFKFPENSVELYAEKVNNRGLCAIAQAESLRYKLLGGLAVRRYTHTHTYIYRCSKLVIWMRKMNLIIYNLVLVVLDCFM